MKKNYQVISRHDRRALARWLAKHGQGLLPLAELVKSRELALEELIDVTGRASIEAVLELSAAQVAGEPHRGRRGGEIIWHGRQQGQVRLAERKLRVQRMRLRRRGGGVGAEVPIPAYEALKRNDRTGARMLEILLSGVSTRNHARVLPEMAESAGIARSAVSHEFIEASEAQLKTLCERRLEELEILIVYIDGIQFDEHHAIVALGVDLQGKKHLLGVREGATENAAVVTELLQDLVARGLDPHARRLFVIDGSKALRAAIERVLGAQSSGLSRSGGTFINYKGILALILGNLPELVLCAIAPFIVLYRHRALSRLDGLIFLFVAGISVALLSQNAQLQVLALPFSLLLIALDIVDRQTEPGPRLSASRSVIWAITIWLWFLYSYPLGVNCALSFAKSVREGKPIGAEKTVRRFLIAWTDGRSSDTELIRDIIRGDGSRLDLFERARVSATGPGMPLSEAEYAVSLEDGFKAARDGCGENARILTADQVNPFPVVLDLPVGGGMVWLEPRTLSLNRHPSADKMFENISCVMVPKMPICYACRELFLRIYGEYFKTSFTMTAETDYWKSYRVNRYRVPRVSATRSSQ